jgi:hypothetical protein
MNTAKRTSQGAIGLIVGSVVAAACGGAPDPGSSTGAFVPLNLSAGPDLDGRCVSATFAPVASTLAIEVLMDQSGSMSDPVPGGVTKWDAVSSAIASFVKSASSAGVNMGIQYFGLPTSVVSNGAVTEACDVSAYATPDVGLGALPRNGDAIVASLAAHAPLGTTPTQPALQGAIDYARSWATAHANQVPVIVLATDGEPYGCGSTVGGTQTVAAQGAASGSRVVTFVVGIGDQSTALDGIAQAGGTGQAFYVDTTGSVSDQFLAALAAVRGSPRLACTFSIPQPDAGTLDLTKVNVTFGAAGETAGRKIIRNVFSPDVCSTSSAEWYFEPSTAAPTSIQLCPATCDAVRGQTSGATIQIALGCTTQPAVTR